MTHLTALTATLAALMFLSHAKAAEDAPAVARCPALRHADFSRIMDASTQVDDAKVVDADAASPTYCQVQGYIAPSVGFELRLPLENWNGKFFEVGCGGFCGSGWRR